MPDNREDKEQKELTVDDLENVAGGLTEEEEPGGLEIGETSGGNKDVRVD